MFKPFYVHYHNQNFHHQFKGMREEAKPCRGFSAFIRINDEDASGRTVKFSASLCAPMDPFNKKMGRTIAQAGEAVVLNKRDVPEMLIKLRLLCTDKRVLAHNRNKRREQREQFVADNKAAYFYVYRYML